MELAQRRRGRALIGFDFPFGYPQGTPLPTGRALCAFLQARIVDRPDGSNNRFDVARELNRLTRGTTDWPGPFWGCPANKACADLTEKKPRVALRPIHEYRAIDRLLRARGLGIQSPFKLFTTGSVGSQVLMGLSCVGRILAHESMRDSTVLWPFETGWAVPERPDAVVVAEIWPTLGDQKSEAADIKDQRQVLAMTRWAMNAAVCREAIECERVPADMRRAAVQSGEGWILGV